jgi:hypothetical protein
MRDDSLIVCPVVLLHGLAYRVDIPALYVDILGDVKIC